MRHIIKKDKREGSKGKDQKGRIKREGSKGKDQKETVGFL
jgi:hypothetical protein